MLETSAQEEILAHPKRALNGQSSEAKDNEQQCLQIDSRKLGAHCNESFCCGEWEAGRQTEKNPSFTSGVEMRALVLIRNTDERTDCQRYGNFSTVYSYTRGS